MKAEDIAHKLSELERYIELDYSEMRRPDFQRRYANDLCDEIINLEFEYFDLCGIFYYSEIHDRWNAKRLYRKD